MDSHMGTNTRDIVNCLVDFRTVIYTKNDGRIHQILFLLLSL